METYTALYCEQELRIAQEAIRNRNTTRPQMDQLQKALAIMYLHSPQETKQQIFDTLRDAERQRLGFELYVWDKTT